MARRLPWPNPEATNGVAMTDSPATLGLLARLSLADLQATAAFARRLAGVVQPGDVLALSGELGVGKTTFARCFINALPRHTGEFVEEEVPSPTFTLVQTYDRHPAAVWHVDLYRLTTPEEAVELGLEEAFADAVTLIEWPERLEPYLPADRLQLSFRFADRSESREVDIFGCRDWQSRLSGIFAHAGA